MKQPKQNPATQRVDDLEPTRRYGRRNPWIAGSLSLYIPGLGQVYNGQPTKGLIVYGLMWALLFAALAILLGLPAAPWNLAIPSLLILSGLVYVVLDAVLTARRQGNAYHLKAFNEWYVYLLIIVTAAVISRAVAVPLLTSIVRAYKIPTGAMENTLLIGDRLMVSYLAYRRDNPTRGDIIVFKYPEDPERDLIKRVIGLAGETIELRQMKVYINGKPLDEPYVYFPQSGAVLKSHEVTSFDVRERYGPVTVPADRYFVLGDNRDYSQDSRYWGFLPRENIRGKAVVIYWSSDDQGYRWMRIGKLLH